MKIFKKVFVNIRRLLVIGIAIICFVAVATVREISHEFSSQASFAPLSELEIIEIEPPKPVMATDNLTITISYSGTVSITPTLWLKGNILGAGRTLTVSKWFSSEMTNAGQLTATLSGLGQIKAGQLWFQISEGTKASDLFTYTLYNPIAELIAINPVTLTRALTEVGSIEITGSNLVTGVLVYIRPDNSNVSSVFTPTTNAIISNSLPFSGVLKLDFEEKFLKCFTNYSVTILNPEPVLSELTNSHPTNSHPFVVLGLCGNYLPYITNDQTPTPTPTPTSTPTPTFTPTPTPTATRIPPTDNHTRCTAYPVEIGQLIVQSPSYIYNE